MQVTEGSVSIPVDAKLKSKDKKTRPIHKLSVGEGYGIKIDINEVIGVFGIRGKGKSFFVKHAIIPHFNRVVIYDNRWGYPDDNVWEKKLKKYPHWHIVTDFRSLFDLMMKARKKSFFGTDHRKKKFYIAFRPKLHGKEVSEFFFRLVFAIGNFYLIVDEMADHCTPQYIGQRHSEILRVGRHQNMGYCGITQRPASVHNTFKGQVTKNFVFRLNLPPDVKYLKDWMGDEMEIIRTLPDFHYIVWDGENTVLMKPIEIKQADEVIALQKKPKTAVGETKTFEDERENVLEVIEEIEEVY